MPIKHFFNKPFKLKKIVFSILISIVLFMLIINFISIQITHYVLEREFFTISSESLNLYNTLLGNALEELEILSLQIATDEDIQDYLLRTKKMGTAEKANATVMHDKIINYTSYNNAINTVHIIDENLNETAHGVRNTTLPFPEVEFFSGKSELLSGKAYWSSSNNHEYFFCSRQILNINQFKFDSLGTIIMRIDKSVFLDNYNKLLLKDNSPLILITYANELVINSNNEEINALIEVSSDISAQLNANTQPSATGYFITDLHSKQYFVAYQKDMETNFTYYSLVPYNEITESIQLLKNTIFTLLFVLLIILFILSRKVSYQFTKPIIELTTSMHKVQNGIYSFNEMDISSNNQIVEIHDMQESFRAMTSKIDYLINDIYEKQLLIEKTRFDVLQSQINPHFLYNTLTSINALARKSGEKEISTMVMSLSNLLRQSIDFKNELITLKNELHLTQDFINIQKIRYPKRLNVLFETDANTLHYLVPKFSIQPLVENAIKYNINQSRQQCIINIQSYFKDQCLLIVITDNGVGMNPNYLSSPTPSYNKEKTGLGLKNIHHRIQILFGDSYGLSIQSSLYKGTSITIRLPKNIDKESEVNV